MRRILALVVAAWAALLVGQAQAADMPYYPDIEIPDVDYGLGGSFYLRGSAGINFMWAQSFDHLCGCGPSNFEFDTAGYGYSFGAGFGYETGDGLRADLTLDYLVNDGLEGDYNNGLNRIDVGLRSTIALANVYYDFGIGNDGFGSSGFGAYVGAGLGMAYNRFTDVALPVAPAGDSVSAVAAIMAGVTYDTGIMVADLGYRGLYMPQISNSSVTEPVFINNAFIHELRGTVRYRFN